MKEETRFIQNVLLEIGIPTNVLGFIYLVYAIELILIDYEYAVRTSKLLYVEIANKYNTETACVERCIRHAIAVAFTPGSNNRVFQLFESKTYKKAPTASQFLARMYFYIINNEHEKRGYNDK